MKLVIVESPTKCKTIQNYLGDKYIVRASLGHVRDLATSGKGGLGVDVDNDFTPYYIINKEKNAVVKELQTLKKSASEVILATDPDREGEAIAWHLAKLLNLDIATNKRLEFHEITRESITEAMDNPRTIDLNLVSAQETRRIFDRIIGFTLSSLIYKKIHSRSAGRVQSAVLKLIADKDNEIKQFVPEEYWNIISAVDIDGHEFNLTYKGPEGKEIKITNKSEMEKIIKDIPNELEVVEVNQSTKFSESKPAFTTSSLQQEAFVKLKFNTKKSSYLAQSLYEGIEINGEHVGLITYIRTDSTRLSPVFVEKAIGYIETVFGQEYVGKKKAFNKNKNVQDAHEAIRPTSLSRTPESVKPYLTNDLYRFYKLIYNRALASLMANKKQNLCEIVFKGNKHIFTLTFSSTIFKGFEIVYKDDEDENDLAKFPKINVGDKFALLKKEGEQKFTQPPAHFSEAKLVKSMEELGIGRPSTYASTIETIKNRKYVEEKGGILTITEQGNKTSHVLEKYFPDYVDAKYTAKMESTLDKIEEGKTQSISELHTFYSKFMNDVKKGDELMYKDKDVPTGELCPKCGKPLVYKEGKNGTFVGCSDYPKCKFVKKEEKSLPKETGELCPKCGKPLVERTDRKGNTFVACSGYPTCKYIKDDKTKKTTKENKAEIIEGRICPKCGKPLVKKKGRFGFFIGCSDYPKCKYMEKIK